MVLSPGQCLRMAQRVLKCRGPGPDPRESHLTGLGWGPEALPVKVPHGSFDVKISGRIENHCSGSSLMRGSGVLSLKPGMSEMQKCLLSLP